MYFDRAVGANLLYRFERAQYAEIRRRYVTGPTVQVGQEKEMSHVYGAEHLLRMIGVFLVFQEQNRCHTVLKRPVFSEFAIDDSVDDYGSGEHRLREGLCRGTYDVSLLDFVFLSSSFPRHENLDISITDTLSLVALHENSWMLQERHRIFQQEYESASLQYQSVSRS